MQAEIVASSGAGPPLVYVPGIDGSGELLLGTAARLARGFRLTRLRYGGEPDGDYASLAASVAACIERLGLEHALVLAESFGVAVALQTALDHPRRVAGLALVNGFARYHDRLGVALTRGLFALAPQAWIRAARARFLQRGLLAPRRDEAALGALLALPANWFDARYRARLALIQRLDLRARLAEIRCPVTLFAAERDRVVASLAAARDIAARIPQAEIEVLPEAGHLVLPLAAEPWEERLQRLAARAGLAAVR
jgi:pimeloyl-ACP methyl ester carboxylesterase